MKKYILSITILLMLLLGASIFLPYLFKDQIIAKIKEEAKEQLKPKLDFNPNININIFKSFPNLNIALKDVSLAYSDSTFSQDTFLSVDKLELSFDLLQFYKEQRYIFKSIALDKPLLNMEMASDSTYSWDIMKTASTSEETTDDNALNLELSDLQISNGKFSYVDIPGEMQFALQGINHSSSGNFNTDSFVLSSTTDIANTTLLLDQTTYLNKWRITQEGDIGINLSKNRYSVPDNTLSINGLECTLSGFITLLEDEMLFDITTASKTNSIATILTLIPAIYTTDLKGVETKGSGKFNATFKGTYSENQFPSYSVNIDLNQGYLKYPDLNLPLEDINLDLDVYSKDGNTDKTVVDISTLHFKMAEDPFDMKLKMQDLFGNVLLDGSANGKINLGNVSKIIPLEDTELAGTLRSDIEIVGRIDDISASAIDKFKASGSAFAENIVYKTPDMTAPLQVKQANISIKNQKLNIPVFEGMIAGNDINFSGTFDNFFGYVLSDQTLKGKCILTSNNFNANDFISEETENESEIEMTLVEIPGNVDLQMTTSIKKLIYDDLTFNEFDGQFAVQNRTLLLQNVSTDLLGGKVTLKGNYVYDEQDPNAQFDLSYSDIKVADLLAKFNIIRAFAPVAEQITAMTTAKIGLKTRLNKDMSPDLSTIDLIGSLNLENILVDKLDVLKGIDTKLGTSHFDVKKLKDLLLNFKIEDGKLLVSPFDMFIDSSKLSLQGMSKLDGSISYTGLLSIPSTYMKSQTGTVNSLLQGSAFQNVKLNPRDYLDLAVDIVGTFKKPELKINLKEVKKGIANNLKNTVTNEVEKKKEEATDRAKEEVNKIKEETQQKAQEAKEKLRKELEQQKKEADERIRKEAEDQKKKLKDEAKNKLRGLIK